MRESGIFDLPSALGIEVSMSDATMDMDECNLSGMVRSDAAEILQNVLREKGASALKNDGWWGPCSESAFYNVFKERTNQTSVAKAGLVCKRYTGWGGSLTPSGSICPDASDVVIEQPVSSGLSKTAISAKTLAAKLAPAKPPPMVPVTQGAMTPVRPPSPGISPGPQQPVVTPTAGPKRSYTWLYVLGGLGVLGVIAFFVFRKKSAPALAAPAPAAVMNRRRHHKIRILK